MLRVVYSFYFFRFFLIKNLIFNFFSFSHSTFNNFFYSNTFLNYSFLLNLKSNTNAFTFNLDNLDYYKLDFSNYLSPRLLNLGYKESLKDSLYHLKSTFLIHYKSFSSIFSLFLNWFKYKNFFSNFNHSNSSKHNTIFSNSLFNYNNFFTFLKWSLFSTFIKNFLNKFIVFKSIFKKFNLKKSISLKFFIYSFNFIRGIKYYKVNKKSYLMLYGLNFKKKNINLKYLHLNNFFLNRSFKSNIKSSKKTYNKSPKHQIDTFNSFFCSIRNNSVNFKHYKAHNDTFNSKHWFFFFKKKLHLQNKLLNFNLLNKKSKKIKSKTKNKLFFQLKFEKEQKKEDKNKIKKLNSQIENLSKSSDFKKLSDTYLYQSLKKPFFLLNNSLFKSLCYLNNNIKINLISFLNVKYLSTFFLKKFILQFTYLFISSIINKFIFIFSFFYNLYLTLNYLLSFVIYKHTHVLKKLKYSFFIFFSLKRYKFFRIIFLKIKSVFTFNFLIKLSNFNFIWSNFFFFFTKHTKYKNTFLSKHANFVNNLKSKSFKINGSDSSLFTSILNASNKSFFYFQDLVKNSSWKSYSLFCTHISFGDVLNSRLNYFYYFTHYNFIKLSGLLTKNGFKIKSENVIIKLFVYLKYSFKKDPFLLLNRCFSKLESGFGVLKFKKSKFAFYSKFIPLYLYKNKLNSLQILYKSLKFYSKSSFKFLLDKLLNEIIEFYIENRKSFSRKLMLQRFSEISSSKKKILLSRNNSFLSSQYFNRFNRNCEFKKLNNNLFFLNSPLISSKYLLLDTGNSFFLKSIKNSFNLKLNKNIFNYRLDFSLFKYFFLLNYNTF